MNSINLSLRIHHGVKKLILTQSHRVFLLSAYSGQLSALNYSSLLTIT